MDSKEKIKEIKKHIRGLVGKTLTIKVKHGNGFYTDIVTIESVHRHFFMIKFLKNSLLTSYTYKEVFSGAVELIV